VVLGFVIGARPGNLRRFDGDWPDLQHLVPSGDLMVHLIELYRALQKP
jgi:hypothetical protein